MEGDRYTQGPRGKVIHPANNNHRAASSAIAADRRGLMLWLYFCVFRVQSVGQNMGNADLTSSALLNLPKVRLR